MGLRGVVRVLALAVWLAVVGLAPSAFAQPKPPPGQADLNSPLLTKFAAVDAEMKALTQEALGIELPDHYCPDPTPPSKAEDEQRLADLDRRIKRVAQAYADAKRQVIRDAHGQLLGHHFVDAGLDPASPNFFRGTDADRDAMTAAIAKLQKQLSETPIKPCKPKPQPKPQDIGQPKFDPNGVEQPGTAAPYVPGPDEKKIGGAPIPPPTYEPFKPLSLPDHFCSITDKHNFKMKVYFPWDAAMGKAAGDAFAYAQKLQDRYWSLRRMDAQPDLVEAAQRTAEYAEARAKDMARQRTQLSDDTYKRIEAIPIVPCDEAGKATGKPPPTPPAGYFNTPHRPVLDEPLTLPPLPDHFCSLQDKVAWMKANYFPLADRAIANGKATAEYMYDLATREQDALAAGGSQGAAYQALETEYRDYEPIRRRVKAFEDQVTGPYRASIDNVPIVDCTPRTPTGVTPPPPAEKKVGVLPPNLQRPQLERWELPHPPESFCSETERVDYLNKVYNPASAAALSNAEKATAYMAQLNAAFTQYMRSEGGATWGAIQKEMAEWKPVADEARAQAEAMRGLYAKIMAIPIKPCAEPHTVTPPPLPPAEVVPPAAGKPERPTRPQFAFVLEPNLPKCFPTVADFEAFLRQLQATRRSAEANAAAARQYDKALGDYIRDREKAGDEEAAADARAERDAFAADLRWWVWGIWLEIDDYAYDARHTRIGCSELIERPIDGGGLGLDELGPPRPRLPGFTLRVPDHFCTEAEKAAFLQALDDAQDLLRDNEDALEDFVRDLDDMELWAKSSSGTGAYIDGERRWARLNLAATRQAIGSLRFLRLMATAAPVGCPGETGQPPPPATGPKKPCPEDRKPIEVGPNGKVGSGARTKEKVLNTAMGLVGGLLGGGGGGGGASGPPLVTCRIKDSEMTVFDDPATGVALRVGAKEGKDGLTVFAKIDKSPDAGTFQTAFLENPAGEQQAPTKVGICGLWGEWQLTVSWTKTTYVDGQVVSREEGGWSKSGTFGIPGVLSSANRPDGLWKRMGFSNASHGAREVALGYRLTPDQLMSGVDLIVHVTRPSKDPVVTTPFILRMQRGPKGIVFQREDKTPCEEAMRVGQAEAPIALCKAAGGG